MKKNIKTIAVLLAVSSVFASFSAPTFAETGVVINENAPTTKEAEDLTIADDTFANTVFEENSIVISGSAIDAKLDEDMFPVRAVAEALDYTVEWDNNTKTVSLTKGTNYITFQVGVDGYTFAKTAPMPLGTAPINKNGTVYTPVSLLSEIMNVSASLENKVLYISLDEEIPEEEELYFNASVTEVDTDESFILVNDFASGEIKLFIPEAFEILSSDGTSLTINDINKGDTLAVEYGDIMTKSLPPINTPKKIIVK